MTHASHASTNPLDVVDRFNETWNRANLDDLLRLITDDCIFENTSPVPDGERFVGKEAIARAWGPVLATPGMRFEAEEIVGAGDHVVVRWIYHWRNADGSPGHIRGIDLFVVRDGKVAEKLSYVKG